MPADREPAAPDPVIMPAFAASKPLIASAHGANLPRALLDAVERPRSLDAQSPKVYQVERYFRQPQLIVVADLPRFAIRQTPPVPGPHSCRSAAAGSIFIARRAGA